MTTKVRSYTVKVNSTQEMVYCTLRDEIVSMRLEPGTAISTQETADRLGVSRTPVREAFIRLQRENLLDVSPQRSTMVSRINVQRVYQERFIREALEIENLDAFVRERTDEILEKLRNNIKMQKLAMQEKRYLDYVELDNEFHQLAMETTHQDLSVEVVRRMNGHYDRIRLLTAWEESIALNAIEEHAQMVKYYEQRDAEAAKTLLRKHLQKLRIQENRLVERWSEYFDR